MKTNPLYLCGGLQSSGSTLISWCFLQREDMDGVLDARSDMLPLIPCDVKTRRTWCKFTISCFRFSEVQEHLSDEGWEVVPLLVVRDVRAVFNSLMGKRYGANGTTAEEPPVRMRLRRFKEDWELFRRKSWAMISYEKLLRDPEGVMRQTCTAMGLEWEENMLTWGKDPGKMKRQQHGNRTFRATCRGSFAETADLKMAKVSTAQIPLGDLRWMEEEFAEFNREEGYAEHVVLESQRAAASEWAAPRYENTRRYKKRRPWYDFIVRPLRGMLGARAN